MMKGKVSSLHLHKALCYTWEEFIHLGFSL